jgi:NhaP-type Na+/H+ or K+/H+ antiporter
VKTDYIVEFKETLVPILVGILFILLAANVDVDTVIDLGWRGLALVAILVVSALAAILGGKVGERYHRRIDRAAFPG